MSFSVSPSATHFAPPPPVLPEVDEEVVVLEADTPTPAPASSPFSPLSPRDSAATTDEAPSTPSAAPEVASTAPAENSNAGHWDNLKTAGKVALTVIGVAAAIAAFVATIGLFTGLVSLFTALPFIAQLGIAAGTLAATIAAFMLRAAYFSNPETTPTPQEQEATALENRLRTLIQEVVPGAVQQALRSATAVG